MALKLNQLNHYGDKIALTAIVITILAGAALYGFLPDKIASHWNVNGVADDIVDKEYLVIGFPLLMIVALFAMSLLPKVKQLKPEYELLHREYASFKAAVLVFIAYVYLIILVSNTDFSPFHASAAQLMFPGISILFYYIGTALPRLKRNHFVGIRTPWTIHNDNVWNSTHKLGGKLFKALAVVIMAAALTAATVSTWLIAIPTLAVGIILVVYSYRKAQQLSGRERKAKAKKK